MDNPSSAQPAAVVPVVVRRDGPRLRIEWSDGLVSLYPWQFLRDQCPCAGCKERRALPPDPFRILQPTEMLPLEAVAMPRVGHYAYKIIWSDGHDTGIFTIEFLRELGLRPECIPGE